ncbi:SAM-dependent methyltransferase [Actinotignum sanguinis]|uniref:class I SAM-dependent methyltransferase n=1 Tax=Actinotignum sanguinis TaxID=1445614 RepID=UPI000F7EF6C4|nr:SAM-dependent methyltransferase [Actinotignum sanguinis]MDY5147640.1 SAM-dependent methyltransferase [Actinotignum sanguinis]RTE51313.1 SAM-dependent methyltransferase [Actinotignum sanguinis]
MEQLDVAHWLTSPAGQALLATMPAHNVADAFKLSAELRERGLSPAQSSAVLTQTRLRDAARAKFGERAAHMFFTDAGLQQSTRASVARQHASVFQRAGVTSVLDFGCGIGADCQAFVDGGLTALGVERDPVTAHFAQANAGCAVVPTDGYALLEQYDNREGLWLDPARRDARGKRIPYPEHWQPALSDAIALAREFRVTGIKLGPGIRYADLPADAFVDWVSVDGDLVEAVAWFGTRDPGRGATILTEKAGQHRGTTSATSTSPAPGNLVGYYRTWRGDPSQSAAPLPARPLDAYLYEPDPALMRAGGLDQVCSDFDLAPISPGLAYLSGDAVASPLLARFKILDVLPLHAKTVAAELRKRGVVRAEIKKRGTDIDPAIFRKQLKLHKNAGDAEATVILTRILGEHRAIVAEREGW